jgi:hypothetical protein
MPSCVCCNKKYNECEMIEHSKGFVCEDCYIDHLIPQMPKMMFEHHPAAFMLRLKDSYIAFPQRYH